MTVADIAQKFDMEILTGDVALDNQVEDVYICDLLSWVMGKAPEGCAFVTIRGHINVIGVASLVGVACVVIAENAACDAEMVDKAISEEIPVLKSKLNSYAIAKQFAGAGI